MTKLTKGEYTKYLPPKLEREGEYEYSLFATYCFLGEDRKAIKVAEILSANIKEDAPSLSKLVSKIKQYSVAFKWVKRARQFDLNRLISQADKLAVEQLKIDADWLEKGKKSRYLLQSILEDSEKIQEANSLLVDAVLSRLAQNPELETLVSLQKIINGVANSSLAICKILSETWQVKDNSEAITLLQNEALGYAEGYL